MSLLRIYMYFVICDSSNEQACNKDLENKQLQKIDPSEKRITLEMGKQHTYLSPDARKPVFEVSHKIMLETAYSSTETT